MNRQEFSLKPEHIRYGRVADLAKLFGGTSPQVCRWDRGVAITEPVLERVAIYGLSKGAIVDAYDLRRKDIAARNKWQSEFTEWIDQIKEGALAS